VHRLFLLDDTAVSAALHSLKKAASGLHVRAAMAQWVADGRATVRRSSSLVAAPCHKASAKKRGYYKSTAQCPALPGFAAHCLLHPC